MNNRGQMRTRLQRRLISEGGSTLYTESILNDLIDDAHIWATQFFPWKELRLAMETSTENGVYWYDYPDEYVTDSVTFLEVDHGGNTGVKEYSKKNFEDFVRWRRENPNDTNVRIFADNERKWYIHPIPTIDGDYNVTLHGQRQADALSGDSSTTIFTLGSKDGNEAIVKKAFSLGILRIDKKLSKDEEKDAIGLLSRIFKRQADNQQLNQRLDHPKFDVPDMFRSPGKYTPTGDFNYANIR